MIKLIECPRDAMQGWKRIISTSEKAAYINLLLQAGFDTIDFGSFVSPKAIPQMADTAAVLEKLDMPASRSKLLAIVANLRGAAAACGFEQISYLGFPFSVSATFQQRNTNSSIEESLERVADIQDLCLQKGKELVVYMSMGFGNPYGDPYSAEIVYEWVEKIAALGIKIISLADTVGVATPEQVYHITRHVIHATPGIEVGVHLHSTPQNWRQKLEAALQAGCTRFDGALKGIGGCPMADDELVGNMDTEKMIAYFEENHLPTGIDKRALQKSLEMAGKIFYTN